MFGTRKEKKIKPTKSNTKASTRQSCTSQNAQTISQHLPRFAEYQEFLESF